jgi:tRNA(Met) C34 N-acetyltransferase TmcA
MAKVKTVLSDPRYLELLQSYQHDWIAFAAVLASKKPTWQQREILVAIQQMRARVSVSSGHGTGKSDMASIIILAFMILNPESRVVVVANNAAQIRNVLWKYLKSVSFMQLDIKVFGVVLLKPHEEEMRRPLLVSTVTPI